MKTADLMDFFQSELQSCEIQFQDFGGKKSFYGPCKTLMCRNDNLLLKQMLEEPAYGHILVVDGTASYSAALLGDMLAEIGMNNNWAGIIINGVIRDKLAVGKLDFGIKALGTNPKRSAKNGDGVTNIPVFIGGCKIEPGDWVYSDEDGILIAGREIPLAQVQEMPY